MTRPGRLGVALATVAVTAAVAGACGANDNGGVITPPKGSTAPVATTAVPPSSSY